MQLDQRLSSFPRLDRLRDCVRSTLAPGSDGATSTTDTGTRGTGSEPADSTARSAGNLFHCPTCAVVYIASEKHVCSNCEGEVEQVRSTLACR
ncbi:hypothetical protein ACFO5R_10005 [Halosolutus amylolyticus]|uniref:Uncharacterized protein n=1 Tax=Halosolutus amylolyticus TaxID=2932267 RepID=A0ABD5PP78_9EURY|nr:hypothetical protein [Halosolutus amylolyticus]